MSWKNLFHHRSISKFLSFPQSSLLDVFGIEKNHFCVSFLHTARSSLRCNARSLFQYDWKFGRTLSRHWPHVTQSDIGSQAIDIFTDICYVYVYKTVSSSASNFLTNRIVLAMQIVMLENKSCLERSVAYIYPHIRGHMQIPIYLYSIYKGGGERERERKKRKLRAAVFHTPGDRTAVSWY